MTQQEGAQVLCLSGSGEAAEEEFNFLRKMGEVRGIELLRLDPLASQSSEATHAPPPGNPELEEILGTAESCQFVIASVSQDFLTIPYLAGYLLARDQVVHVIAREHSPGSARNWSLLRQIGTEPKTWNPQELERLFDELLSVSEGA